MGSRLRQLRLLKFSVVLTVIAGAAMLVSAASGSSFPGQDGKIAYSVYAGDGKPSYIVVADADGSGAMQISKPNAKTEQGDFEPRFSADGTKVVFTRNASKTGYDKLQLWIADANGKGEHQLKITGMPKDTFPDGPTFTPDGKSIVFVLDTINAPVGLAVVPADGGKAKQITTGDDWQPAVSPDGTKVAFINGTSLVVTSISGKSPTTLYSAPQTTSTMDGPDWSPDGKTIAFTAFDSSTGIWDIWTIASDGSANGVATNLTNGTTTSSMDPSYSPEGDEIAFTSIDISTFESTIDVMADDGNDPSPIISSDSGFVSEPDWGVAAKASPPPKKHHHKKHHKKKHHKKKTK